MKMTTQTMLPTLLVSLTLLADPTAAAQQPETGMPVSIGPRPFYLVQNMEESALKDELSKCTGPFRSTDFSIAHRGAPLQFPEHTKEGYLAAATMGAGVGECDVTFTKDRQLVCRHSQCDLATTTNILAIPELAAKCSEGFSPAVFDKDGKRIQPASAKCCTSDITLAEFKSLKGKMDAGNSDATSVEEFMNATPSWRTDLYSEVGTLMTHKESIELFRQLGMKMTPELKAPEVTMPYDGEYTQEKYAQQMIDEYKEAQIPATDVFAQSFNLEDILYWIQSDPAFGKQAVYLVEDDAGKNFDIDKPESWAINMKQLKKQGVEILAPPLWMLVTKGENGKIVPSAYAMAAKDAGLDIITWSLERSGPLKNGGGWYYQSIETITNNDGDMMTLVDVLAQQVGVIGIFSDWPATVTFYANCKGK